jgi:nucleotide-binding universal stress UspA family protein
MAMQSQSPVTQPPNAPMCFGPDHRTRMLVPVDCSNLGEAVLDTAACTARLLQAEVHLIAVLPETDHATVRADIDWYPSYSADIWPSTGNPSEVVVERRDQALDAAKQQAQAYLQHAAERFAGLNVTTNVLMRHSIGTAIIDYARECQIDLIAMATHGRQRLAQALLGSVASEVVHSGVAPVLLVKPAGDHNKAE